MRNDKQTNRFAEPRPAKPDELDQVLDTVNDVMRVAQGLEPTIRSDYPMIYNEDNISNIMIIKDGSRVISSAAIWVNTVVMGSAQFVAGGINCLVTLPAYRRQGLAAKVMEACHVRMRELGCHLGRLTTDIANWYRRIGWEAAGILCSYEFNRSNVSLLPALPDDVSFRSLHNNDMENATIATLIRLYEADRLGGIRTRTLMRTLLGSGSDPKVTPDTWIVLAQRRGEPVAYLLDRSRTIVEWAGPGELVAALLRAWEEERERRGITTADRHPDSNADFSTKMTLIAPGGGHSLVPILRSLSLPYRMDYWGMLYVLDPRGVLDAFGHKDISIRAHNDQFVLTRDGASVRVNRRQLTKLLFGPECISDFARDLLPFTFWEWPLEHV